MFSLKKLNEKISAKEKEKHWKKHYAVEQDKKTLSHSEPYLSLNTGSSKFSTEDKDHTLKKSKKLKNKQKLGPSWRFHNKIANEETQKSVQCDETGSEFAISIKKAKKCSLKLHKTIDSIQRKEKDKKKRKFKGKSKTEGSKGKIFKKSKSLSTTSNAEVNNDLGNDDETPMDAEVARFYRSLSEDTSAVEMDDLNSVPSHSSKYTDLVTKKDEVSSLYFTKENKLYLCSRLVDEGSLLVALFPDTKIYFNGNYWLKLILGSVSVLGYKFMEGEQHIVFSPPSHSTLSINVLEGVQIKTFEKEKLQELNIPFDWAQDFNIAKDQFIAVVKLSRYESNMTQILSETKLFQSWNPSSFDLDLWKEAVGVHLIEDAKKPELRLLHESVEWSAYIEKVEHKISNQEKLCFVITGGKNLGKSTFVKFLINTLLNNSTVTEVACLDLDPGQSEFSVPSCLSLSRVNVPLLGPSFSHIEKTFFTYQRHILLGDTMVQHVLKEYLDIVKTLLSEFRTFKSSVPLVVNTMGFTVSTGFDIMVDVLRIIQPTHVVTIESRNPSKNYPHRLHSNQISRINRGIMRFPFIELNYDLTIFKTLSKASGESPSRLLREINIMSYLSNLWNKNESNIIGETCKPPIKINWTTIAIHVQGSFVPQTHIMQSINASLVALCRVNEEHLEEVGTNMPFRIQDGSLWIRSNVCLGWGIVKGIDPISREIYILTPLDQKQISDEVNMIAMTKIHLPTDFQKLFSTEGAPYWQISKEGQ